MQKQVKNQINQHCVLTIACIFTLIVLQLVNNFRVNGGFDILNGLRLCLFMLIALFVLTLPFVYSIFLTYKYLSSNRIIRTAQMILVPLLGAVFIPAMLIYKAGVNDDRWLQFGAIMGIAVNVVLYLANEILLFVNLRKS
ncbi:hypothetical protein KJ662_03635 [Patescibacteria group bacterium]|nr:hypothetical protein [Patescibacteria group bacterium]